MKKIGYENLGTLITWNCGTGKLFPSIAQYIFRGQKKKKSQLYIKDWKYVHESRECEME